MKTKNSRNSNLYGPYDNRLYYSGNIVDMGGYDFGETSVENSKEIKPLLSDAILDLMVMSYGKIGDVSIRSEMISPEGVSQKDVIKVGVVGGATAPSTENLLFFGKIMEIKKGDTTTTIKGKMMDILNEYVDNNVFLKEVVLTNTNDISITYKDSRRHDTIRMIPNPHYLDIEINNIEENSYGVGKWEYLGEKIETFTGGAKKTLYYYERIG